MDYFGRLKKLWDDLNECDVLPSCSCSGCSCNLVTTLSRRRDDERIREFLMGLDSSFANIRSQIQGMEPLPNLNQIYNKLIQEESVRNFSHSTSESHPEPMAFAARARTNSNQSRGAPRDAFFYASATTKLKCTACNRSGHSAKTCFRVTGKFPDWWGDRPRPTDNQGRNFAQANVAAASPSSSRISLLNDNDRFDLNSLTQFEWDELKHLWQAHKASTSGNDRHDGNFFEHSWIIDTGASHHMSGNLDHFSNITNIDPSPVGMPNGDLVVATKSGDIILGPKLVLRGVLYDRCSRTVIGVGEQHKGLYYLCGVSDTRVRAYSVSAIDNVDLWHRRLGHPSLKITKLLPFYKNSIDDFSRSVWVYLLPTKSAASQKLKHFIAMIDR
ncbi:hypothetical protein RND81_02G079600 [Saponaria officinalis]|uniref:GAG-pre-integrase domain-containing protein n=1 Tax=Saponaria officinalis TaxID=3572 RepID=A0AAW1MTS0_SAPOF